MKDDEKINRSRYYLYAMEKLEEMRNQEMHFTRRDHPSGDVAI